MARGETKNRRNKQTNERNIRKWTANEMVREENKDEKTTHTNRA